MAGDGGDASRVRGRLDAPLSCLSRRSCHKREDCQDEATCRIRKVFGDLFSAHPLMVESLTLAGPMSAEAPGIGLGRIAAPG